MDKVVGRNIRIQRLAKKLPQTKLAGRLGIAFQQLQKYEKGTNRINCGRLFEISKILEVPLLSFFEGGDATVSAQVTSSLPSAKVTAAFDLLDDSQSLKLVLAFARIPDAEIRSAVLTLVRAMVR